MVSQNGLAFHHFAVHLDNPFIALTIGSLFEAGADFNLSVRGCKGRRDAPWASRWLQRIDVFTLFTPHNFGQLGAAKPTSRNQEGQPFQKVGLSGTIGSRQHHRAGVKGHSLMVVTAKIGQRQPSDRKPFAIGVRRGVLCR